MKKTVSAEQLLEVLNTHYSEAIFVTDGDGKVIFVNETGARRLHTTREKMMYRNVRDLIADGVYSQSTTLDVIETGEESISALTDDDELIFTPSPRADIPEYHQRSEADDFSTDKFSTLSEFTDIAEKRFIEKVIEECGGSVSRASKRLGIHRSALYRKLQK